MYPLIRLLQSALEGSASYRMRISIQKSVVLWVGLFGVSSRDYNVCFRMPLMPLLFQVEQKVLRQYRRIQLYSSSSKSISKKKRLWLWYAQVCQRVSLTSMSSLSLFRESCCVDFETSQATVNFASKCEGSTWRRYCTLYYWNPAICYWVESAGNSFWLQGRICSRFQQPHHKVSITLHLYAHQLTSG